MSYVTNNYCIIAYLQRNSNQYCSFHCSGKTCSARTNLHLYNPLPLVLTQYQAA